MSINATAEQILTSIRTLLGTGPPAGPPSTGPTQWEVLMSELDNLKNAATHVAAAADKAKSKIAALAAAPPTVTGVDPAEVQHVADQVEAAATALDAAAQ